MYRNQTIVAGVPQTASAAPPQRTDWSEVLVEDCKGKAASAKKHLDEASSSIPDNIAEGNGIWSKKERKKFFEVARASALECASCLDVLVAKRRSSADRVIEGKKQRRSIVNVLTRMIENLSEDSSQRKKRRLSCSCSCLLPPAPAPASCSCSTGVDLRTSIRRTPKTPAILLP